LVINLKAQGVLFVVNGQNAFLYKMGKNTGKMFYFKRYVTVERIWNNFDFEIR